MTLGLKPCPFCGGEPHEDSVGFRHFIHCHTCGTDGPEVYAGNLIWDSPIDKWNNRPPTFWSKLKLLFVQGDTK